MFYLNYNFEEFFFLLETAKYFDMEQPNLLSILIEPSESFHMKKETIPHGMTNTFYIVLLIKAMETTGLKCWNKQNLFFSLIA